MNIKNVLWGMAVVIVVLSIYSYTASNSIENLRKDIDVLKGKLYDYKHRLNFTQKKYENVKDENKDLKDRVNSLEGSVERLRDKNDVLEDRLDRKYTYYLPTPTRVEELIKQNDVDDREWSDKFDCTEFSFELTDYLNEKGIRACVVELEFSDGDGHMLVSVNTTEGVKYIEPQDDTFFDSISLGEDYCDIVDWNCESEWNIEKVTSCHVYKVS